MRVEDNDPLAGQFPKRKFYWRKPNSVLIEPLHYAGCRDELGDVPIPATRLRGMWMEECGVRVGDRMAVEMGTGFITLRLRESNKAVKTQVIVKKSIRAALLTGFILRSCIKAFRRGFSGGVAVDASFRQPCAVCGSVQSQACVARVKIPVAAR